MAKRSAAVVAGARRAVEERYARFVAAYLLHNNATRAATEAGYSAKSAYAQGYALLKKPEIQSAIERGRAEINAASAERLAVSSDRVIAELAKIGFSDLRRAVSWSMKDRVTGRGRSKRTERRPEMEFVSSAELDDDTAGAISEVSMTAHGMKLKFYDKRAALVDLGKVTGVFNDEPGANEPVRLIIEWAK